MKKWLFLFFAIVAVLCPAVFANAAEKYEKAPSILATRVESEERSIMGGQAYIYKEYLITTNDGVNEELRSLADAYDEKLAPLLQPVTGKNRNYNSRLEVNTVYYRTGEKWISTMLLAEVSWKREQLAQEMTTRTFDLETGERIMLRDLFPEDSEAWDVLAEGVATYLQTVFPDKERSAEAIKALCARDMLEQADFTLSGMELTLHYHASLLFEGNTHLLHVRFYYPQLEGMLSPLGVAITDNSHWKMVAITCDDGPKEYFSSYALTAFRKAGARVTFFHVGKQLERYGDVFQRQMDQNHSFGSHTYHHWSGYTFKKPARRLVEFDLNNEITLGLVGEAAAFFRAPGGTYPPWMEAKLPIPLIQWSLDTYDYTGKNAKRIFYSVRNNVKEYDIILSHDTGKHFHEAIPLIGDYFFENGYMMVTLQELLAAQGVEAEPNVLYWSFRPGENSDDRSGMGKKKK